MSNSHFTVGRLPSFFLLYPYTHKVAKWVLLQLHKVVCANFAMAMYFNTNAINKHTV